MTKYLLLTLYSLSLFFCTAEYKGNARAETNLIEEKTESKILQRMNIRSRVQHSLKEAIARNYINVGNEIYPVSPLLNNLYQARKYKFVWLKKNMKPKKHLLTYLDTLENSKLEGLDPNFYYMDDIERNINELKNLEGENLKLRASQLDLLISSSSIFYFSDLLYGRYKFSNKFIEQSYIESYIDIIALINKAIKENIFHRAVNVLLPDNYLYHALKKSLAKYENIRENGGWQTVPPGEILKLDMNDDRVIYVKHRLHITDDLKLRSNLDTEQYLYNPVFDTVLEAAVKKFQKRHGLQEDGDVGQDTITAMNISVDKKINSIKTNMDVWRKLPRSFGNKYVLVNIPAFKLFGVENNAIVLEMRTIVGSSDWNTPIISKDIKFMVINPYWNIPPEIFAKETLPSLRNDPDYIEKENLEVVSLKTETVQENYSQNWSEVDPDNFNYRLRQIPGPTNPLGRIKFIFPNEHNVYLHDTPDKELFDQSDRKISHGCIRIEKPLQLAEFIFNNDDEWDSSLIISEIKSGQPKEVHLKRPMPVHIVYFTAWAERNGSTYFRNDFYNYFAKN